MCQTCSTIKFEELVKNVCKASQSQAGSKLDLFVKNVAMEAADDTNKHELIAVLKENNLETLSSFITKYVKDFPEKFHTFVFKEVLE